MTEQQFSGLTPPALVYLSTDGTVTEITIADLGSLTERERQFLRGLLRTAKRRLDEVEP